MSSRKILRRSRGGGGLIRTAPREVGDADHFFGELAMFKARRAVLVCAVAVLAGCFAHAAQQAADPDRAQPAAGAAAPNRPADAVADAQTPRPPQGNRPEQQKTAHDRSDVFKGDAAPHSSTALPQQPDEGKLKGFDFSRDPLGAKKPMQTFEETMAQDVADKPKVMAAQRKLLESRYDLNPKLDPQ